MSKTELPSIDNELAATPHHRVDLTGLKPRELMADEAVEANSRAIGKKWGATTQIPITESLVPLASVRCYIPQYLDDELSVKAAERRVTKTFLMMEALAKAGYHVDEIDFVQDRRRPRQKGNM